jgi:hypothetical protein
MGTKSAPGSTECGLNIGSILGIVFAVLLCCIGVVVCVYCKTRGASDDDATESEVLVVKTSTNDEVLVVHKNTAMELEEVNEDEEAQKDIHSVV